MATPLQYPRPVSLDILAGVLRLLDGAACLATAVAALALTQPDLSMPVAYYAAMALLGTVLALNALSAAGVYRPALLLQDGAPFERLMLGWLGAMVGTAAAVALSSQDLAGSWSWLLLWCISGGCVVLALRALLAVRFDQWRQAGRLRRRVAVFGSGAAAQALLQRLGEGSHGPAADHVLVGVYGEVAAHVWPERRVHMLCGDCAALLEQIRRQHVDAVILAPGPEEGGPGAVIESLRQAAVDIYVCPDTHGLAPALAGSEEIAGMLLMMVERRPLRSWRGLAKAAEDRVFAACALMLISPVLALIAALIKLDSPGPVLFRQKRYGLNNQLIEVLKFRTMRQDMCDQTASQLTRRNDPRVTRIGRFLRRTSLDELPQFINVLLGEMSVVGPRPHATAAKAAGLLYQDAVPNYDCRHRMKPGITGLAQVSGWRGETETLEQIRKRVEHDIYYIENWSLLLDAKIILRTVAGGFTGRQAF
jgi:Undecaprenyl-phosphate glucose phosphotransferase